MHYTIRGRVDRIASVGYRAHFDFIKRGELMAELPRVRS